MNTLLHTKALAAIVLAALDATSIEARADCNPREFQLSEVKDIQQSGSTELAFVLTATEDEFNSAKKNASGSGSYGLISASADYAESKEKARSIAQSIKFDYKSSYASNYFVQTLSSKALANYESCLEKDKEKPGLVLWLRQRDGDYFTFNAFWVGRNTNQATAKLDEQPLVDGASVITKPATWSKGKTEQILVKRNGNADFYLGLKVGGEVKSIVIVKDPPSVVWRTLLVSSERLLSIASHGPNPGCTAGEAVDCIYPLRPGGYFVPKTAVMSERNSSDPGRYKETYTKDTHQQVCVVINQGTGGCEVSQTAKGRLAALERFPTAVD
ncbi:MAG: hypothetical protein IPJ08_18370 [Burkholderiales bacterium]|nr:hypothetical protein [Burkholderiales bacterium]